MPKPNETELSSNWTVEKYKNAIIQLAATQPPNDNDIKNDIATFVVERFTERYITPINVAVKDQKHGFCTMAISCLMIETLQCFWVGWPDTNKPRSGKEAFVNFISRTPELAVFNTFAIDFYTNVRCGILHQGETKGGWKINRGGTRNNGQLFVTENLSIDATWFHKIIEASLAKYAHLLRIEDKGSERWINFRAKMQYVCSNCEE
jgi:hypothetical protein